MMFDAPPQARTAAQAAVPAAPGLRFVRLCAAHLAMIQAQPSQELLLGQKAEATPEEAEILAGQPVAWAALRGDRVQACFGIMENAPGKHGIGWALLASGIGAAHLELTRFVKAALQDCGLDRVELLAKAHDIEVTLARHPGLDSGQIVALAMTQATPEMRWAALLGLTPVHLLRRYGPEGECFMLFETIRGDTIAEGSA